MVHGGSQTGMLISVAEYPDHQTWGRSTDATYATPEGQALTSELNGVTGPVDVVFSGIYIDLPL